MFDTLFSTDLLDTVNMLNRRFESNGCKVKYDSTVTPETVVNKNEDGSSTLYVELPGVKKCDIDAEIVDSYIKIKAERELAGTKRTYLKTFRIGDIYDISAVKTTYVDGVLTVQLPLKAKASSKIVID